MKEFLQENKLIVAIVLAILLLLSFDFRQYKVYNKSLRVEIYKKEYANAQIFKELSSLEGLPPLNKLNASFKLLQKYQAYPAAYLLASRPTIEVLYEQSHLLPALSLLSSAEKLELERKALEHSSLILALYKKNHISMYSMNDLYDKAFKEAPGLSSWLEMRASNSKIASINQGLDEKIRQHLSQLELKNMPQWAAYYEHHDKYIKYSQSFIDEAILDPVIEAPINANNAKGASVSSQNKMASSEPKEIELPILNPIDKPVVSVSSAASAVAPAKPSLLPKSIIENLNANASSPQKSLTKEASKKIKDNIQESDISSPAIRPATTLE